MTKCMFGIFIDNRINILTLCRQLVFSHELFLSNGGIVLVCLFLAPVFMLRGDMLGTVFHVNVGSVADATAVRFDVLMFNFDVH